MSNTTFAAIQTWVFDLDNTLYPPSARLFDQIEAAMHRYVVRELGVSEAEANHLRKRYWLDHGTTLNGLMRHHNIDPDPFLREVHDIDLSALTKDEELGAAIMALPGRKVVYTNGSRQHGERVSAARGLLGCFDAIYGVEDADYLPKPQREAFATVFRRGEIAPETAAMFEDCSRNLEVPHGLGIRTILVGPPEAARHIDHQTEDLAGFLSRLP